MIIALASGCGGASIEQDVRDATGDSTQECERFGVTEFAAERESLWRCAGIAPELISLHPDALCYVRADGNLYEVPCRD